jgi:aspartyl-tRNA(Asn)/glutamyl-tRNA(Gln) amidotransferase subunit C
MPIIDRDQVHKVANLARLEMTAEEEEQLTAQMSSILEYFQQLSELDTTDVPPTTRAIDVSNVTRADELRPYPDREAILKEAPDQDGDFFKVPKILQAEE